MSHNNSYGNYAGSYLNQCLPNIKGKLGLHVYSNHDIWVNCALGEDAFSCGANLEAGNRRFSDWDSGMIDNTNYTYFNANSGAVKGGIYRNICFAVRPKSYVVYMWVRTS